MLLEFNLGKKLYCNQDTSCTVHLFKIRQGFSFGAGP